VLLMWNVFCVLCYRTVLAHSSASSSPQTARSYGIASIVFSIIGIVVFIIIFIIILILAIIPAVTIAATYPELVSNPPYFTFHLSR